MTRGRHAEAEALRKRLPWCPACIASFEAAHFAATGEAIDSANTDDARRARDALLLAARFDPEPCRAHPVRSALSGLAAAAAAERAAEDAEVDLGGWCP